MNILLINCPIAQLFKCKNFLVFFNAVTGTTEADSFYLFNVKKTGPTKAFDFTGYRENRIHNGWDGLLTWSRR